MFNKKRKRNIYSNKKRKNLNRRVNEIEDDEFSKEDYMNENFDIIYEQARQNRRNMTKNELRRAAIINHKRAKKKKKKSIIKRIFIFLLVLIIIAVSSVIGVFYYYFGGLKTDKTFTTNPSDLGLTTSEKINKKVTNIALFGVDSRDNKDNGRSDTTMVASFDGVHKGIKLTSLLRDSRVIIDGHGKDKLCHAYSYGGPKLAVKTINQNYKLDITEYITVNFSQMAQIIDTIGGVDITLTQKERVAANGLINSTPDLSYSEPIPEFEGKEATVHLNGAQAVSYARIRKIDSETQRAGRQQTVLQALFDKIMKMGVLQYPKLIKNLLPYVETSLSYTDLLKMLPTIMSSRKKIIDYTIPDAKDKNVYGGIVSGVWYWLYDLDEYSKKLYDFIYNTN